MFRSFSLKLAFLCLLLLLPTAKLSAQTACLSLSIAEYVDIDENIDSSIASTQLKLYAFDVYVDDVIRFDAQSYGNLRFTFYKPQLETGYAPIEFSEIEYIRAEMFSTAYWFRQSTQVCLAVYNPYLGTEDYEFELSRLRFRNGRLSNTDNLTDVWGYNTIGNYYFYLDYYQSAYDSYALALELNDSYSVVWSNFAGAAYQLGLYDESIEYATTALNIDSENINAYGNRGASYSALADYANAIADYEAVQELDADDYYWPYALGMQYMFNGDAEAGVSSMERYARLGTESLEKFWLGLAEYNAGDYEAASSHFEAAIEDDIPRPIFYLWLGLAYRSAGREAAAEDAFAEADEHLDDNLTSAQINFYSAFSNLTRGDYDEAQAFFEEVLNDSPLSHQNRVIRLYLTVLVNCFPDEEQYAEMRDWFNQELGLD